MLAASLMRSLVLTCAVDDPAMTLIDQWSMVMLRASMSVGRVRERRMAGWLLIVSRSPVRPPRPELTELSSKMLTVRWHAVPPGQPELGRPRSRPPVAPQPLLSGENRPLDTATGTKGAVDRVSRNGMRSGWLAGWIAAAKASRWLSGRGPYAVLEASELMSAVRTAQE